MQEGQNYRICTLLILIFVVPAYALIEIGFRVFIEFMSLWPDAE